jgi:hypothetical protein
MYLLLLYGVPDIKIPNKIATFSFKFKLPLILFLYVLL